MVTLPPTADFDDLPDLPKKKLGGSVYWLIGINLLILLGCVVWSWSETWWAYFFFVLPITVYAIIRTLRQKTN